MALSISVTGISNHPTAFSFAMSMLLSLLRRSFNKIDQARSIICDVNAAVGSDRNIHRSAQHSSVWLQPAGYEIVGAPLITFIIQTDHGDLVAGRNASVPGAVVADQQVEGIVGGPSLLREKSQAESRRMSLEIHMGRRLSRAGITAVAVPIEIAVVDVFAVTRGPAVIVSILDDVYLIRRNIIPEVVPAVFRRPDISGFRVDGHENRVPQTGGKKPWRTAVRIGHQYRRPPPIRFIADVAVRAYRYKQFVVIGRRPEHYGPGEMRPPAGQVDNLSLIRRLKGTPGVIVDRHLVGFGDIKCVIRMECQSMGTIQSGDNGYLPVGDAISVSVRKRNDPSG